MRVHAQIDPAAMQADTTRNLLITPHCGLYDPDACGLRCIEGFAANLRRRQRGERLEHIVEPARGY